MGLRGQKPSGAGGKVWAAQPLSGGEGVPRVRSSPCARRVQDSGEERRQHSRPLPVSAAAQHHGHAWAGGLLPARPGVALARPRPRPSRRGDLEEGGRKEERAVPCRFPDGRTQGFARRGQRKAAPRIPRCRRGEPGPARPGRKTEAAGRGGACEGRGLRREGTGPARGGSY